MGAGIAQVAAQSGFTTLLFDLSEPALQKAELAISKNLQSLVDKQRMKEEEKADLKEMVFVVIRPDGETAVCRIDLTK